MIKLKPTQKSRIRRRTQSKRAAVFDIDGTLTAEQLMIVLQKGIGEAFPARRNLLTPLYQAERLYKETRTYNYEPVIETAVELIGPMLKGAPRDVVENIAQRTIELERHRTYITTRSVIQTIDQLPPIERPVKIAITGAPMEMAGRFCDALDFDLVLGVTYFSERGVYTGERDENSIHHKGEMLQDVALELGLDLQDSLAFGDTSSDISMLEAVRYRYAINPKPTLQRAMRETELDAIWISDHQSTGVQAYRLESNGSAFAPRLKREVSLQSCLPTWLKLPSLPGQTLR